MPINWTLVENEQPSKSGTYWCQVLNSPFDNDKRPSEELVYYDATAGVWDTPIHLPVYGWDKPLPFEINRDYWNRHHEI
jgi:hypothetical protein